MTRILIPLPSYGFDPTEAAIPWNMLHPLDIEIQFATPNGKKASADTLMLSGDKLGIWKKLLQAQEYAIIAYKEMERCDAFNNPLRYEEVSEGDFDGLLLPGGHDKGVREYLESTILQKAISDFFAANKPVGAICHGVVLAARSINPVTHKSVLYDYKTTALLKSQELGAYQLTRLWLNDYYLTYPGQSVEDEVRAVLYDPHNFMKGPMPLYRDDLLNLKKGFAVTDRNYVSARWPGDAYNFSLAFLKCLRP